MLSNLVRGTLLLPLASCLQLFFKLKDSLLKALECRSVVFITRDGFLRSNLRLFRFCGDLLELGVVVSFVIGLELWYKNQ